MLTIIRKIAQLIDTTIAPNQQHQFSNQPIVYLMQLRLTTSFAGFKILAR